MFKFTITEDDCKHAKQRDCSSCPAAKALHRVFPFANRIYMYPDYVCIELNGKFTKFDNSFQLSRAITDYDENGIKPLGTFVLKPA